MAQLYGFLLHCKCWLHSKINIETKHNLILEYSYKSVHFNEPLIKTWKTYHLLVWITQVSSVIQGFVKAVTEITSDPNAR